MTLPTPDAQSSGFLPQQPHSTPPTHSMPNTPPYASFPSGPLPPTPATDLRQKNAPGRAVNFADRSWDLATGGLKTLTAKRELPPRLERREKLPDAVAAPCSSRFIVVIVACILVMLISGGIVLFMVLQP